MITKSKLTTTNQIQQVSTSPEEQNFIVIVIRTMKSLRGLKILKQAIYQSILSHENTAKYKNTCITVKIKFSICWHADVSWKAGCSIRCHSVVTVSFNVNLHYAQDTVVPNNENKYELAVWWPMCDSCLSILKTVSSCQLFQTARVNLIAVNATTSAHWFVESAESSVFQNALVLCKVYLMLSKLTWTPKNCC